MQQDSFKNHEENSTNLIIEMNIRSANCVNVTVRVLFLISTNLRIDMTVLNKFPWNHVMHAWYLACKSFENFQF